MLFRSYLATNFANSSLNLSSGAVINAENNSFSAAFSLGPEGLRELDMEMNCERAVAGRRHANSGVLEMNVAI